MLRITFIGALQLEGQLRHTNVLVHAVHIEVRNIEVLKESKQDLARWDLGSVGGPFALH